MLIPGYKKYKEPTKSKGLDNHDATFTKYGKEIKVHDFIQAGRDGTETKQLVEQAGGLKQIKGALEKIPSADFTIDLNMDAYTANKLLKVGQIAEKELKKQAELEAELNKIKQENQKNDQKGIKDENE